MAEFFSEITSPGYKNVNELAVVRNRLHSSQTLFGDLNAEILILLQDSANWETFAEFKNKEQDFFRHDSSRLTNKKLTNLFNRKFAVDIDGENAENCGLFCANIVWLLKQGNMSARLEKRRNVVEACRPIFDETIQSLGNLKLIIAFGKDTFKSISELVGLKPQRWPSAISNRSFFEIKYKGRSFGLCTAPHPAARGSFRERISPHDADPWGQDLQAWVNYVAEKKEFNCNY
jgi:hypothetical protein